MSFRYFYLQDDAQFISVITVKIYNISVVQVQIAGGRTKLCDTVQAAALHEGKRDRLLF